MRIVSALASLAIATFALPAFAQQVGYVTMVTAGFIDPNGKVPTFTTYPGAGVSTLSEAVPLALLTHGDSYNYLVVSQNGTYTGTCTTSFSLTEVISGVKTTLEKKTIKKDFACKAGDVWGWDINGTALPDKPGVATLTGSVKFGTKTISLKVPVLIQ
jgi:hypothetical protein